MIAAIVSRFFVSSDAEQLAKLESQSSGKSTLSLKQYESFRDVNSIDSIGNFSRQVLPVSFDDIVLEKRNQHFEFKDAEYVLARKAAWTVHIMDVADEDVISDYLSRVDKREQFAYFRYIAPDKSKRYILIFDDFNGKESAEKAIENNEFDLPPSIKPYARSFKDYVGTVDSYHLQRNVRDLKRSTQRHVILHKTHAPSYNDSGNSIPVFRRSTEYTAKRRVNKPNNSAFRQQPKRQGRIVQPDIQPNEEIISSVDSSVHDQKRTSTVVIEERSLSGTTNAPANKPAMEAAPKETSDDNLSNLINRIDQ